MGLKIAASKGKDTYVSELRQLNNQAADHKLQVLHVLSAPVSA